MCFSLCYCLGSTSTVLVLGRGGNLKLGHPISRIRWQRQPAVLVSSHPLPLFLKPINPNPHSSRVLCNFGKLELAEVAPTASTLYGLLLLSGGLYAFTKSGSKGSLFGGLTGAALMAFVYFLMQAPETRPIGDALGFGSAFLFSSVFGIRFAATRKFTPAGPLLAVSICALLVFMSAYLRDS